jgi:hypothetical protein
LAGGADAGAVDEGEGVEIVNGADCVPGLEAGGGVTGEEHLAAAGGVFVVDGGETAAAAAGVGIVDALALTHGIEAEDNETEFDESLAEALVGGVCLADRGVAHLHEDGGKGAAGLGGDVEVAGDVEVGAGLEDDFIDPVAGAFECTGDAGVDRSGFGLATDEGPELLAGPAAPFVGGGGSGDAGEVRIAALIGGEGEFAEIGRVGSGRTGGRRCRGRAAGTVAKREGRAGPRRWRQGGASCDGSSDL